MRNAEMVIQEEKRFFEFKHPHRVFTEIIGTNKNLCADKCVRKLQILLMQGGSDKYESSKVTQNLDADNIKLIN